MAQLVILIWTLVLFMCVLIWRCHCWFFLGILSHRIWCYVWHSLFRRFVTERVVADCLNLIHFLSDALRQNCWHFVMDCSGKFCVASLFVDCQASWYRLLFLFSPFLNTCCYRACKKLISNFGLSLCQLVKI